MRWTVVVPGALVPTPIAADVFAGATAPWLMRTLAQGLAEPAVSFETRGAPHLHWLWQRFGGTGEPVTAPYALQALAGPLAHAAQCWHIDPVHFAFARDHLLVTPLDDAPPTTDEAATLARHLREALAELFAASVPQLHVHAGRWLLTLARPWSMQATPLDGALGQSAHEHWPRGADAAGWRKLLTEVQVRWHHESLNEAREARGERAVNALWLHGGGAWSALPARPFAAVVSDDPVLRGWALASGAPADALHPPGTLPAAPGDAVSIWRELLLPAQFEAWGQWLQRLTELEAKLTSFCAAGFIAGYGEIALVLCGCRQVRIVRLRRGDGWRFWRKTSRAYLLAETEGDAGP
jgi:hypothetical protein